MEEMKASTSTDNRMYYHGSFHQVPVPGGLVGYPRAY